MKVQTAEITEACWEFSEGRWVVAAGASQECLPEFGHGLFPHRRTTSSPPCHNKSIILVFKPNLNFNVQQEVEENVLLSLKVLSAVQTQFLQVFNIPSSVLTIWVSKEKRQFSGRGFDLLL